MYNAYLFRNHAKQIYILFKANQRLATKFNSFTKSQNTHNND